MTYLERVIIKIVQVDSRIRLKKHILKESDLTEKKFISIMSDLHKYDCLKNILRKHVHDARGNMKALNEINTLKRRYGIE